MFHIGNTAKFSPANGDFAGKEIEVEVQGFKARPDGTLEYRIRNTKNGRRLTVSDTELS